MRIEKCQGCPDRTHKPLVGWDKCEKNGRHGARPRRLCETVDLTLREFRPNATFDELSEMTNALSAKVQRANLELTRLPTTSTDFIPWIEERHRFLFGGILDEIAGKIRTEPVVYGLLGSKHEREGTRPDLIRSDLVWVFEEFEKCRRVSGVKLARIMAVFLQKFFEVHPFTDGNGRVGRLFVASLADELGYRFVHDRGSSESDYLQGLQTAHMWCARKSVARDRRRDWDPRMPKDPLWRLEKYISPLLVSFECDSEVEEPPVPR